MNRNRFIKLFPVLCWMGLIFYLSSQPAKDQDLAPFFAAWVDEQSLLKILPKWKLSYSEDVFEIQHEPFRFVNFLIRKGAHIFSYALLAILWLRFLRTWNLRLSLALSMAFLASVAYGASDEWHQTFVAGRTGAMEDIFIDACGALMGLSLFVTIRLRRRTA
ncbi:MAG: VanZ family protein [Oligoflexus sp.]